MAGPERVPLTQVADLMGPGQPLPFRVLDGAGRLLLAQGQVIHDGRQLAALLERGACVERIEADEVRRTRAAGASSGPVMRARVSSWFDRWEQQVWALDGLLRRLAAGTPDEGLRGGLDALADGCIELVGRQPDAALFVAVRQDDRRFALYALTHALHTAAVAWLAAGVAGWPDPARRTLVRAALTMNASIVELQARMAEQKEPPSRGQIEQIRSHPHRSAALLRGAGIDDVEWLTAVEDHHERAGPDGYPRGHGEPGELARLLRAADVYTAKISPRALRVPLPPQQAARELFQTEQGGPLAGALIKAVGVYPPGDLVQLRNGEGGVVVQRATAARATQVAVLLNAQGRPVAGAPRRDTGEAATAIAGPLADRSAISRVLPEVVYGLLV